MEDYKQYFIKHYPKEAVGYFKDNIFYPLDNIADDPYHFFKVDPSFLVNEPDSLVHSHISGYEMYHGDPFSPSLDDMIGQVQTDIEWGICVTDGETCSDPLFWGNPDNRPELLGRKFIPGLQDCLALMRDWYYQELNINLPEQPRSGLEWQNDGLNTIDKGCIDWGFYKIPLSEIRYGDVLVYRIRSDSSNHLGVYLGNNEVISHWVGRLSAIEPYGKWATQVSYAIRHKDYKHD